MLGCKEVFYHRSTDFPTPFSPKTFQYNAFKKIGVDENRICWHRKASTCFLVDVLSTGDLGTADAYVCVQALSDAPSAHKNIAVYLRFYLAIPLVLYSKNTIKEIA